MGDGETSELPSDSSSTQSPLEFHGSTITSDAGLLGLPRA